MLRKPVAMDSIESIRTEAERLEDALETLVHELATRGIQPEFKVRYEVIKSQLVSLNGPIEHYKRISTGAEYQRLVLWSFHHSQKQEALSFQARAFFNTSLTPVQEMEEKLLGVQVPMRCQKAPGAPA